MGARPAEKSVGVTEETTRVVSGKKRQEAPRENVIDDDKILVVSRLDKYKDRPRPTEFEWSAQEEPHKSRRKEILAAHPEIADLFTYDIPSGIFCILSVLIQLSMIVWIHIASDTLEYWKLFLLSWVVGGTIAHSLALAVHELTHDLHWPKRWMNKWCGYLAALPSGFASSNTFRRYHMMHHSGQGDEIDDLDIATELEAYIYRGKFGKLMFLALQVFSYALRPGIVYPLKYNKAEKIGWAIQIPFNLFVFFYLGSKPFIYMLASNLLGLGLHPMSGHFISEHYVFLPGAKNSSSRTSPGTGKDVGQETYSYYGPLNYLSYNVGYHNEHHDFPRIPGRLLPKVKEIAPEFYSMPCYSSWCRVMWDFVMCDHITLRSRVKRRNVNNDKKED